MDAAKSLRVVREQHAPPVSSPQGSALIVWMDRDRCDFGQIDWERKATAEDPRFSLLSAEEK
jgi:hypothetical protein